MVLSLKQLDKETQSVGTTLLQGMFSLLPVERLDDRAVGLAVLATGMD